MPTIQSVAQSLAPDAHVALFLLDASSVGGGSYHFVQGRKTGGDVSYGGQTYTAIDIDFKGLETSGVGALPTPSLVLANTNLVPQAMVNTWGDLLGCVVYRWRTFARYLDGGASPDGAAYFGPDTFKIDRKVTENAVFIEWQLSAAIDQEGKLLPGRQIIRDTCMWRYRIYNAGTDAFDYSKAICPYTGTTNYDINDQVTALKKDDVPSRRLSCCKTRFGANAALPFGGFPGVARVRA